MKQWTVGGNNYGDVVLAWDVLDDYSYSIRFLTEMYDWGYYTGRIFVGEFDEDGTQVPRNWTYGA